MNTASNARRILQALDERLTADVELTLYGRAALHLGFPDPPSEFALSMDIDVILWVGQAQALAEATNFWQAIEETNQQFATEGLYVSHLFEETQVILRPNWRAERVRLAGDWSRLSLWRLGDLDLLLSKLMRDDPQDLRDALFIVGSSRITESAIHPAITEARIPDIPEIKEQFAVCCEKLLRSLRAA